MTPTPRLAYTAGYSGHTPDELRALAERLNALVCDIRLSPRSRRPEWNRGPLQRVLGDRYVHLPELGNRNYRGDLGDDVLLDNPDAGIARLNALHSPVLLLCQCKEYATCHRRAVACLLEAEGWTVQEIGAAGVAPAW